VEDSKSGSKLMGRRRALQLFGMGLTATSFLTIEACSKPAPAGSGSGPGSASACDAQIDEPAKQARQTLQYFDKAVVPEKHCSACAQFIPDKFGTCGGGCKVIGGPVNPNGGCLAFAPLGGDAGTVATPAKSG
jgi:hypothetical protein